MWGDLLPLIIAGAVVPIQLIFTILLLRSEGGRQTALAFVLGMTTVRIAQGVIFGLMLDAGSSNGEASGPGVLASSVLIVLAVLLYVTALRELLADSDSDDPPPKWMALTESATPAKGFILGAGLVLIGAKFWVFTLSAISIIADAAPGQPEATLVFILFVVLTASIHIVILATAFIVPSKSEQWLTSVSAWLADKNRVIMITLGVVFGTWFLVKGLNGLGVI